MKTLIVFDLDGTLALSKSAIDDEMSTLLRSLLGVAKVAIISGGDMSQFEQQVVAHLPADERLKDLFLLPTNGTRFYRYDNGWQQLYAENLSADQKTRIIAALKAAVAQSGFGATQTWGDAIEDRESQITYSALGQAAPLDAKKTWDPDFSKRQKIKALLDVSLSIAEAEDPTIGSDQPITLTVRRGCHPQAGDRQGVRDRQAARHPEHPNLADDLRRRCALPGRQRLSGALDGRDVHPSPRPRGNQARDRDDHRLLGVGLPHAGTGHRRRQRMYIRTMG